MKNIPALFFPFADLDTTAKVTDAMGGIGILIIGLCILFLMITWVVFPLLMVSRIGEVIQELRTQNELLDKIIENTKPSAPTAAKAIRSSVLYEALQPEKASRRLILGFGLLLIMILFGAVIWMRQR
jgi:hypothetical protein